MSVRVTDVDRRVLSGQALARIVEAEIADRHAAAIEHDHLGQAEVAKQRRAGAAIFAAQLAGVD